MGDCVLEKPVLPMDRSLTAGDETNQRYEIQGQSSAIFQQDIKDEEKEAEYSSAEFMTSSTQLL